MNEWESCYSGDNEVGSKCFLVVWYAFYKLFCTQTQWDIAGCTATQGVFYPFLKSVPIFDTISWKFFTSIAIF